MSIHKNWAPATICHFDSHEPKALPPGKMRPGMKPQPVVIKPKPADLVSVCVTVYNYSKYLDECLDSIKAQTHASLDMVIVDDCSKKDDSAEVAQKWAEKNQSWFYRVRVISHIRNQGPSEARNTAFRATMGAFVFIIDADNEIYPRAIERLYAAAMAGPFDATYSQLEKYGDQVAIGDADLWDVPEMCRSNYVDIMALIRRAAWEKIDGFSHIENGWEDYDFWLKFITAGFSAAYVPEILSRYRVHGKSRTATEAHAAHEDLRVLMAFRHGNFDIRSAAEIAPETVPQESKVEGAFMPEVSVLEPGKLPELAGSLPAAEKILTEAKPPEAEVKKMPEPAVAEKLVAPKPDAGKPLSAAKMTEILASRPEAPRKPFPKKIKNFSKA